MAKLVAVSKNVFVNPDSVTALEQKEDGSGIIVHTRNGSFAVTRDVREVFNDLNTDKHEQFWAGR